MMSHLGRYPPPPRTDSWSVALLLAGLVLSVVVIPAGPPPLAADNAQDRNRPQPFATPAGVQWVVYYEEAAAQPDARLQEEVGNRILALERYDSERLARLYQRWGDVSYDALSFIEGRNARVQEALGLSIATAAQRLHAERSALDAALAEALDLKERIRSGAWFQERLGQIIVQTAASLAPTTPHFAEQIQAHIRLLSDTAQRIAISTDARIAVLSARQAAFPREAIARLADAVADGHRVARFYDASVQAQLVRVMGEIQDEMAQTRSAEDYRQLAETAEAAIKRPWNARGFLEFGAAALLGAILMMAWVALSTKADFSRTGARTTKPSAATSSLVPRWRGKVARPQSTTLSVWPREVIFGAHCTRDLGHRAASENTRHATILTDQGIVRNGLTEPVKASLAEAGVTCDLMDRVSREVPHTVVEEIAGRCREAGTDLLVAIGGGSVIDTAKAVGVLLTNGGLIRDYEGIDRMSRATTPLYAVPTTAGSGSEISPFCIVRDTTGKRKFEIFSRKLIPAWIFIDPLMTRSMPPDLTASSGMDALANAIEAYFSTWANPLSDTLALDAVRLIAENLRAAVANGQNLHARQQMALAAFEAGLAITNAQSGAVHALGHSLSGLFDIPERIGDAILLPHVMKANMYADVRRMAKVAEALGEPVAGLGPREAAQRAIEAVKLLLVDVGLPTSLEQVGIDKHAISTLSEQALHDPFLRANPRALNRKDIAAIYEDAFVEYTEIEMESAGQGTGATAR